MEIRIFDIKDGITTLGPGRRFCIWTQGCPRKCPGCMTPNSQPFDLGHSVETDWVVDKILKSGKTGLTISGGEPFIQSVALIEIISKVREKRDLGVIIYTGYTIEEINSSTNPTYKTLLKLSDLLIDGIYIEELNDGKNLRGSSNQRAILLTDRYEKDIEGFGTKPSEVEFFYQEDKISMVGIPSREVLERLKKLYSN